MNGSCHTYELSYITHMKKSCHTCERVISHIWMEYVAQIKYDRNIIASYSRQGYGRQTLKYAMSNMGMRCVCSWWKNVCAMTHSHVRRDSFLCVTRLIFMCDMAREYIMAQIYFDGNTWSHRNFDIDDGICIYVFIYVYMCVYVCIYL